MKCNKLLLSVLCAGFITTSVMADAEIKIENKEITVTCGASQGMRTAMTVVRKGHSLSEKDWVVAIKESAENDGKAVFSFNMPDIVNSVSADGEYVIYTKSAGVQKSKEFIYVSPDTITAVKDSFSGVTSSADIEEIFENADLELALEFLGFDMESYKTLNDDNKAETCQTMLDAVNNFANADDSKLTSSFAEALLVTNVNTVSAAGDVGELIGTFTFENVDYNNIADSELKAWITDNIFKHKPYAGYEDVVKEYNAENMLYKINNARFSGIKAVLEEYASELGFENDPTYIEYKGKADNGPLNERIVARLGEKKPNTAAQLMSEIKDVMRTSGSSSGSTGGGGAGGGGGLPSGNYAEGTATKPTIVLPVDRELPGEKLFDDVSADFWGKDAIKVLVEDKIISGDGNGNFRPNDRISREEFIKMAVSIMGAVDDQAVCSFADVKEDDWFYKYVATAVNAGIIYGVSDGHFGSGQGLSRQDMAVICARAFGDKIKTIRDDVAFSDEGNIESYAKDAVHKLYTSGVISGMDGNSFAPNAFATRAQAAQILYKLFYN